MRAEISELGILVVYPTSETEETAFDNWKKASLAETGFDLKHGSGAEMVIFPYFINRFGIGLGEVV